MQGCGEHHYAFLLFVLKLLGLMPLLAACSAECMAASASTLNTRISVSSRRITSFRSTFGQQPATNRMHTCWPFFWLIAFAVLQCPSKLDQDLKPAKLGCPTLKMMQTFSLGLLIEPIRASQLLPQQLGSLPISVLRW